MKTLTIQLLGVLLIGTPSAMAQTVPTNNDEPIICGVLQSYEYGPNAFQVGCRQAMYNPKGVAKAVVARAKLECGNYGYYQISKTHTSVSHIGITSASANFECSDDKNGDANDSCMEECGRSCMTPPVFCGKW